MPEEEKIVIGMNRPLWSEFKSQISGYGYVGCACGDMLSTVQGIHEHWQQGHFDTPVYCTRQELIKAKLEQIEERRRRPL